MITANCSGSAGFDNCLRHNLGYGLCSGRGVYLKLRISVPRGLGSCVCFGISNFRVAGRVWGNWVTISSQVRGAVVMQRLLTAKHRQLLLDTKSSWSCLACRSSSSIRNGTGGEESDKRSELEESPLQDVVLKAISEVSKSEGRVGKTTNMVIGGTVKMDSGSEWNAIDQKVNVYPMVRDFTAIGTGGDEFVQAMVQAVESVTETPVLKVTKKLSSQGNYVSVTIRGITLITSEQVRAVYDAMRKDVRMKYFL